MLKNENKDPMQDQPNENADETSKNKTVSSDNSSETNTADQTIDEVDQSIQDQTHEKGEEGNNEKEKSYQLDADTKDLIILDLQEKQKELNDKYLRLFSEFDNFRKRNIKERMELTKTASADMTEAVLPVLDDLERAYKSATENPDIVALTEGVSLILNKLKTILKNKGLEEIPTLGQKFDTDFHEAITHIPSPTEDDKGKVIDEVQKGYTLNGKIIRFAKVVVAN
jgi:molecular chaperone GrpE